MALPATFERSPESGRFAEPSPMFPREHDVEKSNADFDKLKTLDEQLQFFKDKYKKRISEEKMN